MTFRGASNGQYQPSTSTSAKDCMAATGAQLVERATVGAIRLTHVDIRRWVLAHDGGRTSTGALRGLYPNEVANACLALGGVKITPVYNLSRNAVRDTVAGGQACGFSIDTSVTRYTSRRTNSYVGPHQVFANEYQQWPGGSRCDCEKQATYAHAEYLVDDPGTSLAGFLLWSADLLYRAAEKRTNDHGINLLVAPDTEGRTWKATDDAAIRSLPSYSKGVTVGKLVKGHEYQGGRTENGGNWKRADGSYGNGWVHIEVNGTWRWAKSIALVPA